MRTASAGAQPAKMIVPQRNNSVPRSVEGGGKGRKKLTRNAIKRRCNYTADMRAAQSIAQGHT
jgi:hypothetical protein